MKLTAILVCSTTFFFLTVNAEAQHAVTPATRSPQSSKRDAVPERAKASNAVTAKHAFQTDRRPGQIDRVKVEWKVGGEVIDIADKKEHREKLSVECNLDYEEKTLQVAAAAQGLSSSLRYYNRAEADENVGEHAFNLVLRPERSLIAVEISSQRPVLFSPRGCLTKKELDLIDVHGNSLLLDRFLPDKPVAVGEAWQPSEELMAQLRPGRGGAIGR